MCFIRGVVVLLRAMWCRLMQQLVLCLDVRAMCFWIMVNVRTRLTSLEWLDTFVSSMVVCAILVWWILVR